MKKGTIKSVTNNYGIIDSDGKKYYFIIFPDMENNRYFKISKKVKFNTTIIDVRNSNVEIAINITPIDGDKKKYMLNKRKKMSDYYEYCFTKMCNKINCKEAEIDLAIKEDIEFKEFCIKWILFLERIIKNHINELVSRYLTIEELENDVYSNKIVKNDIDKVLKKIGSQYMFREEFELLIISRNDKDDNLVKVERAPLLLILNELDLSQLGRFINVIYPILFSKVKDNENTLDFIKYTKSFFSELCIIRNASAHGKPLIPNILDDSFTPSYIVDMTSAFPDFNSGKLNNVEKWELFNFIRFTTKQSAKMGISPYRLGSPQISGLYTTKYILINPIRRSLFSLFFIILCYEEYIKKDDLTDFWKESSQFIGIDLSMDEVDEINKNLFFLNFPSKSKSVIMEIYLILFPLLVYKCELKGQFDIFLSATQNK